MRPKKIILIAIDTLRADHLGCYGSKRDTSQNVDRMAKEGILFKHAFSPASHTIPSFGSIFTSKYPSHHSIGFNQNLFVETGKLNTDIDITLAEILNTIGYKTAGFISGIVIGKDTNFNAGFEIYDDDIGNDPFGRRTCEKTNQRVFDWLEKNLGEDFFLFIHYYDVHGPFFVPDTYKDLFIDDSFYGAPEILNDIFDIEPIFNRIPDYQILKIERDENQKLLNFEKDIRYYKAQYDATIRYTDDNLGNLFKKLKDLNIFEESLIIITADHGEAFGENNVYLYHGLTVTLDQISIPLILKPHKGWNIERGIIGTHVSTIDIMPTLLSLCNYDYCSLAIEGHSLKKIIENRNDIFWNERTLLSENERQYALINPGGIMEIKKKETPTSTYYPYIPALIDSLNGYKYCWESGKEYVLNIPFDIYQRYKITSDIINKFRFEKRIFRILDVGAGFEGTLKKFIPDDNICFLDKDYPPEYKIRSAFISGDITKLEVDDKYDFVVSIDVYEHIDPISRENFINKLINLSKVATIIAAPFDTPGVKEHEVILNELYNISHGIEYKWLHEHIQNGLPSLSYTMELIKKSGFDFTIIPNGYLPRWFEMISISLLTEGSQEFSKSMEELNEFYNKKFYSYDNLNPSYRQVIIINKSEQNPDYSDIKAKNYENDKDFLIKIEMLQSIIKRIKELHGSYKFKELLEKNRQVAELTSVLQAKEAQMTQKEAQFVQINSEKEAQIAQIKSVLQTREAQIRELNNVLQSIQQSMVWRATMFFNNRIIDKLLPQETGRRKTYDLALKSFKILITEGWGSLLQNYKQRRNLKMQLKQHEKEIKKLTIHALENWNGKKIIFPIPSENPDVSIVIPVHNNSKYTYNCLNSILKNTQGAFEIIVIDDASSDETPKLLRNVDNIRVIRNDKNLGFIESCNIGAESGKGKYLFFLNNDTIVTENWLEPLISAISKQDVGAVGSKLIYPDGKLQEAGGIIWNDASGWNYGRYDDPDKPEYNFIREVDYCSGAALLVKKDLFEKLGGFDIRFKPGYYEDTDICFSIRESGFKVLYQPESVIFHFEGATGGTNINTGVKKYQEINRSKFFEKWKDVLDKHNYNPDASNLLFYARDKRKGKNILIIDHYVPTYDRDSGSYRMFNILRILSELGHKPTFAGHNLNRLEPYTGTLQKHGIEVIYSPHIKSINDYLIDNGRFFDIVILSRSHIAVNHISSVKKHCSKARIILDTVDLQYLREMRRAAIEKDNNVMENANELKNLELQLAKQCDVTLVVSTVEKEILLKEEPSLKIEILSNIHEIYPPERSFSERKDIMFLGGFEHLPNIDAVNYFVKDILPLIRNEIKDVKFYVVGSNPPEEIRRFNSNGTIVTGYVKDLKPYFEKCRVFVAPLRYGAGVKGKIGEAMAHGLPVVTTSIGAEGMMLKDGANILIADAPLQLAKKIIMLHKEQEIWNKISKESIEHLQKNFSYEAGKNKLELLLKNSY